MNDGPDRESWPLLLLLFLATLSLICRVYLTLQ